MQAVSHTSRVSGLATSLTCVVRHGRPRAVSDSVRVHRGPASKPSPDGIRNSWRTEAVRPEPRPLPVSFAARCRYPWLVTALYGRKLQGSWLISKNLARICKEAELFRKT